MKQNRTALVGMMSAAAMALGVQQAGATVYHLSDNVGAAGTTWTKDNTYCLDNLVVVPAGQTLTIQPGTVIRGMPKSYLTPNVGGSLLISRGGKLIAKGTAAEPIVFTDQYDDNVGTNTGSVVNGINYGKLNNQLTGQWGGLVVAGRGYIAMGSTAPSSNVTAAIEGMVGTDYQYGGGDDNDNSGELDYISIRYGGTLIAVGKEINGLSLPGVGRSTKIDHIDVYNTKDDAYEIWGGAAQAKHLLAWNATDDQFDTDSGWRGKIQFALAVQGISTIVGGGAALDVGDKGLEWDGAGDKGPVDINYDPQSCGTLWNFTLVGMGTGCGDVGNTAMNIRHNAGGRIHNGIVLDFAGGCTLIEGVTNGATWPYVASSGPNAGLNLSSAAKMAIPYGQDSYYTSGTNSLGELLPHSNYFGYDGAIAGSMKTEIKDTVFWKMGIPHSIGLTQGCSTADSVLYMGQDNGDTGKDFEHHGHYGAFPNNTGFDVVGADFALTPAGNIYLGTGAAFMPINHYERETTVYTNKASFRPVAYPYTCVAKIDPIINTNLVDVYSLATAWGQQPPNDGFYSQVKFPGAMARKNWAGPWSTAWRLGGFVTTTPTGDENGATTVGLSTNAGNFYITVDSDLFVGKSADWFCVANQGATWKYLTLAGTWANWNVATLAPATMTAVPLADYPAPGIAIPISSLPTSGTWTIYAGVDPTVNNKLDLGTASYAFLNVVK